MGLEELISRLTEKPARRFGIDYRGRLEEGYYGDVVVLDRQSLNAPASYENPCRISKGVRYLTVNGCMEIWEGRKTGRTGGGMELEYCRKTGSVV